MDNSETAINTIAEKSVQVDEIFNFRFAIGIAGTIFNNPILQVLTNGLILLLLGSFCFFIKAW